MRAFIVRPFGIKNEINFDEVERLLVAPALKRIGAEGGTTIDIVEAGNIRVDMFRRLLTADLVVADLSIHNANVFYELGIRHALRDHGTFMMRCEVDKFPFDLQTDRYFIYKKEDPGASLEDLVKALQQTKDAIEKDATAKDSPVFMSLPNLSEPDPSQFMAVPQDFGEEVGRAVADRRAGDLALLSYEVNGFEWEMRGWRAVGGAQFDIKALVGAKETWEAIRKIEPNDLEANIRLGTVYERLGDLTRSTQALERALANRDIKQSERAEAYSLLARNSKTRWREEWEAAAPEERAATALRSPHLQDSFENYERAFNEDLNHFYSGLNALAMIKLMLGLAEALPDVWAEQFKKAREADAALEERTEQAAKLAAAVELSLNATSQRLEREGRKDVWAEISAADLNFVTTAEAQRFVAASYRTALAGAPGFASDSVRKQLAIYRDLGVLGVNLAEVFKVVGEPPALPGPGEQPAAPPKRKRVLLFAGHMIDEPGREKPRFPADKEQVARERIKEAVLKEVNSEAGVASGYAGGASGGDILFQEVCAELNIPTRLYLAIPPQKYVTTSVQKASPAWVERFWKLYNDRSAQKQLRVLSDATDAKDAREYLPAWLRQKQDYGIWQRNNLWMLFNALDEGCDPKSDEPNLTLIALWDGATGDGPGGTGDLVEKVEGLGARSEVINTKELFGL
ncbi:MAG TPA: tetratricopeptide repeat-containing protein [Pyrinomonadaceae bacterium]|nr:tetratricopeptide repeat-containing protein [Pyrinomonadaceae bacterium]